MLSGYINTTTWGLIASIAYVISVGPVAALARKRFDSPSVVDAMVVYEAFELIYVISDGRRVLDWYIGPWTPR